MLAHLVAVSISHPEHATRALLLIDVSWDFRAQGSGRGGMLVSALGNSSRSWSRIFDVAAWPAERRHNAVMLPAASPQEKNRLTILALW